MTAAELMVRRVVAELARRHPDGDTLVMTWAALGLDSLDVLELAVRCEEEFGIAIPDRALVWCHTPGEVVTQMVAPAPVGEISPGPEGGDRVDHRVIGVGPG